MDISYILAAIVVGLVAGFLARALMPGKDSMSLPMTVILGLAGSFLGAFLFRLVGIGDGDNFDFGGIIAAIIGSLILLGVYNAVTGRKKHGPVAHR